MSPLTPKLFISAIFGLIYGVIGYFMMSDLPDAWRWGLIFGLGAFAIFLLVLLIKDDRRARRYERAEKKLPCPPQFRVGANMRTGRGVAGIHVYLCDGEMYLVSVHGKEPEVTRVRRFEVRDAKMNSVVQLDMTLHDGRVLSLLTPYMEDLVRELRRHGWNIPGEAK